MMTQLPPAPDRAVAELERAVKASPGDLDIRLGLAFALLDAGRFAAARSVVAGVLRQQARTGRAVLALSKVARGLGDRPTALKLAREAAALDPSETGIWLDIGLDLVELGQLEAAEAAFRALIARVPAHRDGLVALGHLARRRGDRMAALAAYQLALQAAPGDIEASLESASALAALGRRDEAGVLLDAVLRQEPSHLQGLMQRGQLAREAGAHDLAATLFTRAVQAAPEFHQAAVALAEAQRDQGRPDLSAATLRGVLDVEPDELHALLGLADQAWLAQDYEQCLALSLQAARAHPGHVAPPLQATRALMEQGRAAEALALLEPIGAASGWPQALVARKVEILQNAGAWDDAAAVLAGAREPAEFVLWLQRMRLHLALGAFEELEAGLAAPPPLTAAEQGFLGLLGGQLAEARWQLARAREVWEAALPGPNAAGLHAEIARVSLLLGDLDACRTHTVATLKLNAAVLKLRGQSLNPSSTHVGQIWDEFRMDRARAERLRALAGVPATARVDRLLEMVAQVPDHLPTAMLLGVALRQAGLFTARPAADPARPIPRRIVQFWDDAEPPAEIGAMMQGWRDAHPDYEYRRFDLDSAGRYLRQNFPPEVVRAYIRAGMAAQKADVFRLAYLAREGGIYADADDRCLAHVGTVLPEGASLLAWQEHFGTLGNNFLAAGAGHPVLVRALSLAAAAINRGDEDIPWLSTGPGLLTRALAQVLAEADDPAAALRGCAVLERYQTVRLALFHQFSAYKRTSRHWLRAAFGASAPAEAGSPAEGR